MHNSVKTSISSHLYIIILALLIASHLFIAFKAADFWNIFGDGYWTYLLSNSSHFEYFITDYLWEEEQAKYDDGFIPGKYVKSFYMVLPHSGMIDFKYTLFHSKTDDHPPLYYCLVHTISYVFRDFGFSKWYTLGINMVCLVLIDLILYALARRLIINKYLSLLPLLFFMLINESNMMFAYARMYVLWTFFLLFLIYMLLKVYDNKKMSISHLFIICLTIILGCLTHLYFWIYGGIVCLTYLIVFIKDKFPRKTIISFLIGGIASVLISVLTWPYMILNMLGGGSSENQNVHYYLIHHNPNFLKYLHNMPGYLFIGKYPFVAAVICILFIVISFVIILLSKKNNDRIRLALIIILPVALTTLFIMKISTSVSSYYINPIFSVMGLCLGCTLAYIVKKIYAVFSKKYLLQITSYCLILVFFVLSINPVYQFIRPKNGFIKDKIDISDTKERHAVYIHDDPVDSTMNYSIFYIGEYGWVKEMTFDELISSIDELNRLDKGYTLFFNEETYNSRKNELPAELSSKNVTYAGYTIMLDHS